MMLDYEGQALCHTRNHERLTVQEFRIMERLMKCDGEIVSNEAVLAAMYPRGNLKQSSYTSAKTIIRRLRAKMVAIGTRDKLETVWGEGVVLERHL